MEITEITIKMITYFFTDFTTGALSPCLEYQAAVEARNSEDKDATTSLKRSSEATTDYSTQVTSDQMVGTTGTELEP